MTVLGTCDWCPENAVVIMQGVRGCYLHRSDAIRGGIENLRAAVHEVSVATAFDPKMHARTSDPVTSHVAAHALSDKTTMMRTLLRAYTTSETLTAHEAAIEAGLHPFAGAWKRVSDLKRNGWIEPTGTTRLGPSGRPQQVCVITDEGRERLT